MELTKLLDAASKGYPDGLQGVYNRKTGRYVKGRHGDTLAEFVVIELSETFDRNATHEDQINEAIRVMEAAQRDIAGVITELEALY